MAESLQFELGDTEKVAKWLRWMLEFDSPWAGFNHLKARIMEDNPAYISRKYNQLELFRRVIFRIARLEREGCCVPQEQWDRELLSA